MSTHNESKNILHRIVFEAEKVNVGIGITYPTYKLDVDGDINAHGDVSSFGVTVTSDVRLKRNIHAFQNGLEVVSKLEPVSYEKKTSIASDDYPRSEIGFIAQDIKKIFPELVREG